MWVEGGPDPIDLDPIFGTPDDDAGAREAMHSFIDNIEVLRLLTQQLEFGTQF